MSATDQDDDYEYEYSEEEDDYMSDDASMEYIASQGKAAAAGGNPNAAPTLSSGT